MTARYTDLLGRLRKVATFSSVAELLAWDQETMMPPRAARFRAEELAAITALAHERAIDPPQEEGVKPSIDVRSLTLHGLEEGRINHVQLPARLSAGVPFRSPVEHLAQSETLLTSSGAHHEGIFRSIQSETC